MLSRPQEEEIMAQVARVCNREIDIIAKRWGTVKRRPHTQDIVIHLFNRQEFDPEHRFNLEPEKEDQHPNDLKCIRGCGRPRPVTGICPCYEEVRPTSGVGWPD